MKLGPSLVFWLALLPGLSGVWVGPTTDAPALPSARAIARHAPDLCISAGHSHATRSTIERRQPAVEEEESSHAKDLFGPSCLSIDVLDLARASSRATLRRWDIAHTSPRSTILRC